MYIALGSNLIDYPVELYLPGRRDGTWEFRTIPTLTSYGSPSDNGFKIYTKFSKAPVFCPEYTTSPYWRDRREEILSKSDFKDGNMTWYLNLMDDNKCTIRRNLLYDISAGAGCCELLLLRLFNPALDDHNDHDISYGVGFYYHAVSEAIREFSEIFTDSEVKPKMYEPHLRSRLIEITDDLWNNVYHGLGLLYDKSLPDVLTHLRHLSRFCKDFSTHPTMYDFCTFETTDPFFGWVFDEGYLINPDNCGQSPYSKDGPYYHKYVLTDKTIPAEVADKWCEDQELLYRNMLNCTSQCTDANHANYKLQSFYMKLKNQIASNTDICEDQRANMMWDLYWADHATSRWVKYNMK